MSDKDLKVNGKTDFAHVIDWYLAHTDGTLHCPESLGVDEETSLHLLGSSEITEIVAEGPKQSFFTSAVLDEDHGRVFTNTIIPLEFCEDHFPGYPMLPMAKLGQIMAQAGSILVLSVDDDNGKDHGKMMALAASVEGIKSFNPKINGRRKPFIVPGDNLLLVAEFAGDKINTKSTLVSVYVGGQLINTMSLTYSVMPFELFKKIYERQQSA